MARVSLDGKVWKDPRVKRLAKRRTWSMREVVGTIAAIWDVAYDSKTPIMSRADIDTAAETEGFAGDLIAESLAESVDDDMVRLRGVDERIKYLVAQSERGRSGGQANAKQTLSKRSASTKQPPSLPNTNTSASASSSADPKEKGRLSGKPDIAPLFAEVDPAVELAEIAVAEINRLRGSRYKSGSTAILKDCASLAKSKNTPAQVKAVISSKAKWIADPKMSDHFKPSVLMRPSNFAKYLDDVDAEPAVARRNDGVIRLAAPEDDEPDLKYAGFGVTL